LKKSLNADVIVVAVGPSTKNALEGNSINVHVMPQVSKMGPIVKALDEYVSAYNTEVRWNVDSRNSENLSY
jgi:uroporphyrinogen-III synthase